MDYVFEKQWQELVAKLSTDFGMPLDEQGIIFLIGVQELGQGHKNFKKDEKLNLMHIAVCRILVPYGYYELIGTDEDGWPHYKTLKKLPPLEGNQQQQLMRQAILDYFIE